MFIRQISVFLENKPGAGMQVFKALTNGHVNIRAMALADAGDYGLLRLIVDQPAKAAELLATGNHMMSLNQVIGVYLNDTPGALEQVLQPLADNGYNVEYAYAFVTRQSDSAMVVLKINEGLEEAAAMLQERGVRLVTEEEAYGC